MLKIVLFLSGFAIMAICHPLTKDDKENLANGFLDKLQKKVVSGDHGFPEGGFNQVMGTRGTVFRNQKLYYPLLHTFKSRAKRQSGFDIKGDHVPGVGGSATLSGNWAAINTPRDQLNIRGSHTQVFDHRLRPVGPGSNSAGFNYGHTSRNGKASWGVGTNTDFGRGRRPVHNIGANFRYRF